MHDELKKWQKMKRLLLPLPETPGQFASLIHEFQPIIVKCPDSTYFPPLTKLDLNRTSEPYSSIPNPNIQNSNHSPPNSCLVEDIFRRQLDLNSLSVFGHL